MSVQALTWAFKQEITPSAAKFVLVALANYASDDLYCFPSQKTIARMTGQTDRSVRTHLVMLEHEGYIRREARYRADGGITSDGYYLLTDPPETSSRGGDEVAETISAPPGNGFHSPRQDLPHPMETASANTKEYPKEQTKEETRARPSSSIKMTLPPDDVSAMLRAALGKRRTQ